jgi:hypothetical protein
MAAYLLLARIVYRVLMSREIVGSRKDGVAGFAGRWIDALALVRSILRVPKRR